MDHIVEECEHEVIFDLLGFDENTYQAVHQIVR